ncbi:hypothetical protein DFH09DRAFT_1106133 [Mycena vulgaris]|nr:hypothetical protein DFH09DRAFT_1106133 [Mycena vulgaris]
MDSIRRSPASVSRLDKPEHMAKFTVGCLQADRKKIDGLGNLILIKIQVVFKSNGGSKELRLGGTRHEIAGRLGCRAESELYIGARVEQFEGAVPSEDLDALLTQGVQYFIDENNVAGQAGTYLTLSGYYEKVGNIHTAPRVRYQGYDRERVGNYRGSLKGLREVQKLARLTDRVNEECESVADETIPLCRLGNFPEALERAAHGHQLLARSILELSFLVRKAEMHYQKIEYAKARYFLGLVEQGTRLRSPYFHANVLRSLAQIDRMTGVDDATVVEKLASARKLLVQLGLARVLSLCSISQDLRNRDVMCSHGETYFWAGIYFAFANKTKDLGHTYQALRYLGDVFLAEGDQETALNVFQAVLDGSTEMDVHRRCADCTLRTGHIVQHHGKLDRAKELWQTSRLLFARGRTSTL